MLPHSLMSFPPIPSFLHVLRCARVSHFLGGSNNAPVLKSRSGCGSVYGAANTVDRWPLQQMARCKVSTSVRLWHPDSSYYHCFTHGNNCG